MAEDGGNAYRQHAEHADQHGGDVGQLQCHRAGVEDATKDAGGRVDLLLQHHGDFPGQHIADQTTGHSGDDPHDHSHHAGGAK